MTLYLQILLSFLCTALAAAQGWDWNGRFGGHRTQQPQAPKQQTAKQQQKQSFHEPLAWRYPEPPTVAPPNYPANWELKVPSPADSVSALCGESSVRVEAKRDLLGIGTPVLTADVTLGGCMATAEDAEVMVFETELHRCGSELHMTEDSFIYSFTLFYTPSPLGSSQIVRTREVQVSIECHYQRKQDVSQGVVSPTWNPFTESHVSEESLLFSISLMTDDWQFSRPSAQFLLGDVMKFEVSVKQFHHAPLRVTVDSCVATIVPNIDTVPRYTFLGNHGCLFDSQLTGSSSRFLPQSQDDRLQFELEAFRFQQDNSGMIYITCKVRARAAAAGVDASHKACSFSNGWSEVSGSHHTCSCCDTDCGTGSKSHLGATNAQWEQETVVGPITVKERPMK